MSIDKLYQIVTGIDINSIRCPNEYYDEEDNTFNICDECEECYELHKWQAWLTNEIMMQHLKIRDDIKQHYNILIACKEYKHFTKNIAKNVMDYIIDEYLEEDEEEKKKKEEKEKELELEQELLY